MTRKIEIEINKRSEAIRKMELLNRDCKEIKADLSEWESNKDDPLSSRTEFLIIVYSYERVLEFMYGYARAIRDYVIDNGADQGELFSRTLEQTIDNVNALNEECRGTELAEKLTDVQNELKTASSYLNPIKEAAPEKVEKNSTDNPRTGFANLIQVGNVEKWLEWCHGQLENRKRCVDVCAVIDKLKKEKILMREPTYEEIMEEFPAIAKRWKRQTFANDLGASDEEKMNSILLPNFK